MRGLLALAVLVSFVPAANAQDKGKSDFSHEAEYRVRYWWTQNPGGDKGNGAANRKENDSDVDHRFKLGTMFRANEKFTANLTLLHNANWGQETNGDAVGDTKINNAGETENFLTVNQAFASWMMSEDFNIRVGRQNYQIADGYVMGMNDWLSSPYAFEGLLANYELEFGKFQAFAFKYRDMENSASSSASKDPEHNAYGLNFDLKTMPEWMKVLSVHVIKDNADAVSESSPSSKVRTGLHGQDVLRYGAMATFAFSIVDVKAWYAATTGKNKYYNASLADVTERDSEGQMMQAEVGATFAGFMNSRVFVQYHQDSGDTDSTDGKDGTYDSYFYERHANSGLMDLIDWGNLTYVSIGWTAKPTDRTDVGLLYTMFSRTESGDRAAGLAPVAGINGTDLTSGVNNGWTGDKLGDEIDVWAEHKYDGGLSTVARLGYFMPGEVFKKSTATAGGSEIDRDEKIVQVMLEGKLAF
jgi:hypothetical protein